MYPVIAFMCAKDLNKQVHLALREATAYRYRTYVNVCLRCS